MKKLLLAILMLFSLVSNAYAVDTKQVDTSGLNSEEIAKIRDEVDRLKKSKEDMSNPANVSETVRKEAEAWGELGANMGKALVGGAKEIGMAANDFASTPLGKVTVVIAVYKIIGREFLGIIFGFMVLVVGTIAGYKLFKTSSYPCKFDYQPRLWGLYHKKVVVETREHSSDRSTMHGIVGVAIMVASSIVGLKCIFQ